jgi:hypothetical protein
VPKYNFTVTEHDADRPWIVLRREHRTAALEAGVGFFDWAYELWPAPRWTVELEPWQLSGGGPWAGDAPG